MAHLAMPVEQHKTQIDPLQRLCQVGCQLPGLDQRGRDGHRPPQMRREQGHRIEIILLEQLTLESRI